ncbi:MAG: KpsF/GutQ family sugar-phosphate isomerase [Pseudomonadota bacterium]
MTDQTQSEALPIDVPAVAAKAVRIEVKGLEQLADALAPDTPLAGAMEQAVRAIRAAEGRVVVTGMGKSGHVARKIAATLASTGQPASYVHPGEASHGDLGMVEDRDVVMALSNSGETPELSDIIAYTHRFSIPLIGLTSRADSSLGKAATIKLIAPQVEEACPETSAPTTSTTVAMALGDALAMALLEARGFTASDFKTYHPGGKLGAQLRRVADLLPEDREVPLVREGADMRHAIEVMSDAGMGCVGIEGDDGRLVGIITDGDLRRHAGDIPGAKVEDVMSRNPRTVTPQTMAGEALGFITKKEITALFVVEDGRPVSVLHVHDLLRQGVL